MFKPIIGITMGDASGIGPEITVKALNHEHIYRICKPVVLGDTRVLKKIIQICNLNLGIKEVQNIDEIKLTEHGNIDVIDYKNINPADIKFGQINPICGEASVIYTKEAGRLALECKIDAMVSAPLHKEAMRLAGYNYEGQTEILGELVSSKNYGMVLILGSLKLLMYSNHMSLIDALRKITIEGVYNKILLAREALKVFGKDNEKIAVSAVNPHGGESGLFGDEEEKFIIPAIKKAKGMGINVIGPIPADTIFVRAKNKEFEMVIAMYHDQANIVMKLLGFGDVVTLLVGIPIIRTSTGHGTAFDIAGKNIANENNIIKAIEVAVKVCKRRKFDRKN